VGSLGSRANLFFFLPMSQIDEGFESYGLDSRCIVPWKDGSMYVGRVQKLLDPQREALIEGIPVRKNGKQEVIEKPTPFDKLRTERHKRVPASVIDECLGSGEKWFFLHYFGWGSSFDEWLPLQRMLPHSPHNIAEMKTVNAEIKEREKKKREEEQEAKAKKSSASRKRKESSTEPTETPRKRHAGSSGPAAAARAGSPAATPNGSARSAASTPHRGRRVVMSDGPSYEIKLALPLEFKRLLVEDWRLVTRDRAIVNLPRPVSVVEILKDFAEHALQDADSGAKENMDLFVRSMTTYFDYSLGMMLLYRFERNAYYYQRKDNAHFKPSLLYGAEHLARLVVSMPALLTQLSRMDDVTLKYIVEQVEALAVFMTEHRARYFAGGASYAAATRAYEIISIPNVATESTAAPEKNEGK